MGPPEADPRHPRRTVFQRQDQEPGAPVDARRRPPRGTGARHRPALVRRRAAARDRPQAQPVRLGAESAGPGRPAGDPARLPGRRPGVDAVPARIRPGRHPGRRHGPGQDGADPGPHPGRKGSRPPDQPGAGDRPDQPDDQLAGRGGALRPGPARAAAARQGAARAVRPDRRRRPGADHLRAAAARRGKAARAQLPPGDPRRIALHQEQPLEGGPERRPAELAPPPVPDRHAARKPPGRTVVAVPLPAAGPAGRREDLQQPVPPPDRAPGRPAAARPAEPPHQAVPAAPDQGQRRQGTAAEDRNGAQGRAVGRPARPVRDRAPGDGQEGARRDRQEGRGAQPDRDPRSAAQAAPGLLRPAPGQGAAVAQEGQPARPS